MAASEFYDEKTKTYNLDFKRKEQKRVLNTQQMIELYENLIKEYNLVSIEDPLDENDFEGFAELTKRVGDKIKIIGDDLLVTNPSRINMAINK